MHATDDHHAARRGAAIIEDAFLSYIKEFQRFTLQARLRFEARDWLGALQDSADRLDVYNTLARHTVEHLHDLLDEHTRDKDTWRAMKSAYLDRVNDRTDSELAETFFNSITRRIFVTVGVDSDLEFIAAGAVPPTRSRRRATSPRTSPARRACATPCCACSAGTR
jgi:isocitrate dehydrogenase kinase/phosphatase